MKFGFGRIISSRDKLLKNLSISISRTCGCRVLSSDGTGTALKKFSDTLQLPKTDFRLKITPSKRKEYETSLYNKLNFDNTYGLQRIWRKDQPEFILHDGPPYANGSTHMGHAVNKILKDITNRYKLLRGYKINYIPGWDCHGLPIENKAKSKKEKLSNSTDSPLETRHLARNVAKEYIGVQKESFKRWGIMADWNSPYQTFDKSYIKAQLKLFYQLYEKGYVYRELKPIYWSPSNKTALAESEIEYNNIHESPSIYVKLPLVDNLKEFLSKINKPLSSEYGKESGSVEAIIWTTNPWTLPSNQAIAFNSNESYVIVCSNPDSHNKFYWIMAKECIPLFSTLKNMTLRILTEFKGSDLSQFSYQHPWFKDQTCPFLHSDHVTLDKGTGLVHIAPAHGNDDYVVALKHKLPIKSYVNDDGGFDSTLEGLTGANVLTFGNNLIIKKLGDQIVHSEKINHSYPYDWRSKKPLIIKTSLQWFIDTEKLRSSSEEHLQNISVYPKNIKNALVNLVKRPYWCISRQRAWGVPIPVFYNKETNQPLINQEIIDNLCDLVEEKGSVDDWWSDYPIKNILQSDKLSSQYEKGKDIFDIWLDSGLSWHILGDKVADLYLEGVDQFNGWFQSSLLTSVALRNHSPYKNIFVHGFVVDEDNKKMSKSIGNVIDPTSITDGNEEYAAFGVDALRWWAATQGSADGSNIPVSTSLLRLSEESVQKLRNVLRFLISFCKEENLDALEIDEVTYDELMHVDQYMLTLLQKFRNDITLDYDEFNYHRVLTKTLHFATIQISQQYFTWIKDRLYCDSKESISRKSAIYVLNEIYLTISKALAPALPFLIEESYSHYSLSNESFFKSTWFPVDDKSWDNPQVENLFDLVMDIRTSLNHTIASRNQKSIWIELLCNEENYQTLQLIHPTDDIDMDKCDSELCDILQVSGIDLRCSPLENPKFSITPFGVGHSLYGFSLAVTETEMSQCSRCRRYCCIQGSILCPRCLSVIKSLEGQSSSSQSQNQQQQMDPQLELSKRTVP